VRKYNSAWGAGKHFFIKVMGRKGENKNYTVQILEHSLQPLEWT
jgi:hypothetical protein